MEPSQFSRVVDFYPDGDFVIYYKRLEPSPSDSVWLIPGTEIDITHKERKKMDDQPNRNLNPYYVNMTPRGAAVMCRAHLVTEEIKPAEAYAMARALNVEHQMRTAL